MARTDEQRAADALLDDAIAAVVAAYGIVPADHLVVDYVAVVEGHRYDADPDAFDEHFGLVMRNGHARTSVITGLLDIGAALLADGERVPPADD